MPPDPPSRRAMLALIAYWNPPLSKILDPPLEVATIWSCQDQLKSENFGSILQFYGEDLPSVRSLDAELDLWQNKWRGDAHLAQELNTPEKVLRHTDADYFPNIRTLIVILGTLPVTSCESERSISMLKRIKTALRSTMTEDRLNGLAMLQYHRDITVTTDEVVEEFVQRQPRRLLMSNPLNEWPRLLFVSSSTNIVFLITFLAKVLANSSVRVCPPFWKSWICPWAATWVYSALDFGCHSDSCQQCT